MPNDQWNFQAADAWAAPEGRDVPDPQPPQRFQKIATLGNYYGKAAIPNSDCRTHGKAVKKIKDIYNSIRELGYEKILIAGGSCADAWEMRDIHNDVDVFMLDLKVLQNYPEHWVFIKDKTVMNKENYDEELRAPVEIVYEFFDTRNVVHIDLVIMRGDTLDEVVDGFDINQTKYFYNPEHEGIDPSKVKYRNEIALERVKSPERFERHIARLQKYKERFSYKPVTCRIDNYEDAFL